MSKLRIVAAALLALPLIVFGGNFFLHAFPLPQADTTSPGALLLQAMRDGGLMSAIAFSHLVAGVMLLVPRLRFAGPLLQLPMSLGMLSFHLTMQPAGAAVAAVLLLLNLGALVDLPRLRRLVEPG